MSENSQGPKETDWQRAQRTPSVLRAYARDIEKFGRPLDSGMPGVLEFAARWIEHTFEGGDARPEQLQQNLP